MAFITTIIFIFTVFSFFIGQIYRVNLFNISIPLIDIAIVLLFLLNLYSHFKAKNFKIKNKYFLYFLIFAWISFVINLFRFQINSLTPIFYLIRLNCLLSFFILPFNIENKFRNIFYLSIIANIIFGFIQYFFWPNFTYFDALNWDPHLYRLVSTFFDPTFTGLIFLFFIIKTFLDKKIPYRTPLLIISYIAMALTYSRSTYLSFLIAFFYISKHYKKISIFLISLIIMSLTIIVLPRQPGEGTKLERTSSITAKIQNYKEAFITFNKSPIVGIGYNNISFIRDKKITNSHANSGFDGSLATILVTTGIIGGTLFLFGIVDLFKKSTLIQKTTILITLFHSLFANSLLYPWILLSILFF